MRVVLIGRYRFARPPDEDRLDYPLYRDWAERLGGMDVVVQGVRAQWETWERGCLRVHFAPRFPGVPQRFSFVPAAALKVVRLSSGEQVDIVNGSDIWGALVGLIVRRVTGARVLFQLQGEFLPPSPISYGAVDRAILYRLTKYVIRRADMVRCLSEQMGRRAVAHGASPARIAVLPTRCDLDLFCRPPGADGGALERVVFVGNLIRGKGVQVLLRAMASLAGDYPRLRCLILGDGPHRARLVGLAKELGLESRVEFRGKVDHDEIPRLLGPTDVFVLPSFSEAMPRAVIEAMALRLPVIATRVGAIPEIIEAGIDGLLVDPGDVDALGAAIDSLLQDPAGARALAGRAETSARARFSYARHRDGMLRLYDQLLAGELRGVSEGALRAPTAR